MAQPDSKKIFFENLSGAGKAIAVLTSGGDAQGKVSTSCTAVSIYRGPQRARVHAFFYLSIS